MGGEGEDITLMTFAHLVYFIYEHQGILSLCLLQALYGFAGHGSNVCSSILLRVRVGRIICEPQRTKDFKNFVKPMTLDLCDISHAPYTEAVVLPVQGSGDTLRNRRFTNTRSSVET